MQIYKLPGMRLANSGNTAGNSVHFRFFKNATVTKISILILLALLIRPEEICAQEILEMARFGAVAGSRTDVTPSLNRALAYSRNKKNITIRFAKGRYDFYPEARNGEAYRIGINIFKQDGLTIDGGGSEFVFHGKMQVADIDSSSHITLRNFSVDWDRPLISQCRIVAVTDTCLDVMVDREKYPFVIEQDTIKFIGEDWKYPVLEMYGTLYDKDNKEIVYNTWDAPLGNIFQQKAEQLPGGIVRFHGRIKLKPEIGTYVSLFHLRYGLVGIHIRNSNDALLKDIRMYHALGHGVLGERTENITMDNASICVNDNKDRVFSTVADASHFVNCKGVIHVENCSHTGQGDDFINVHGRNVVILSIIDPSTMAVKTDGRYITAGDSLWFIDHLTAQRGETRIVKSVRKSGEGYLISFTQAIPKDVKAGWFTENKTWTAGLRLLHCKILKRNRARGILVTTPKSVVIEENYFRTAGTAILIEGDLDYWFESGANKDVQIRNNLFEDCLTSGNKHGDRWEWGDAVITITPSHRPQHTNTEPYHQNIHIENNRFKVFDAPLIRAVSVRGLFFTGNSIVKTASYEPYTWQKAALLLDGCRQVEIGANKIDPMYSTREVTLSHMRKTDIRVLPKGQFKINL